MKTNISLLIYFGLICYAFAELKLTGEDVRLPTKTKKKWVDMQPYEKLFVNNAENLMLRFKLEGGESVKNNTAKFYFNERQIEFTERQDVHRGVGLNETYTLIFTKYNEDIVGKYRLTLGTLDGKVLNATGNIFAPPFLQEIPESIKRIEGERLQVTCQFMSYPGLNSLTWSALPPGKSHFRTVDSNTTSFKDVIVWDLLVRKDAGFYSCVAINDYGNDTIILQIRVKDRLAPLWPFIGILIEIGILVIIIVVHEHRKNQKKAKEINKEPQRQSLLEKDAGDESSELRQRSKVC